MDLLASFKKLQLVKHKSKVNQESNLNFNFILLKHAFFSTSLPLLVAIAHLEYT